MQFFTAAAAFLSATTAVMAAPTPSSSESTTYQLKDFTTRTYDGENIGTMYFNIVATNGGTLDLTCSSYDPALGHSTDSFESGKVYACGENSLYSFSYTPASGTQTNELFLWQDVSEGNALGGNIYLDSPGVCHAGGSTINDETCSIPDDVYVAITMDKLGAENPLRRALKL